MKNILFIMGDQHRFDCIGAYGNKDVKTNNLDGLAKDGVLYNNHFTTYPVCTPARYSLLSGLYTHQHLGWSNHCTLPKGIKTYPRELKNNGFNTVAVGKMHSTPTYLDVGFDKMILAEQDGDGRFDDDYHQYLIEKGLIDINDIVDQRAEYRENAEKQYWDTNGAMVSNLKEEDHSTTWITNKALEEIENWGENNNLLLVSYIKPHHPFDPPEPFDKMYSKDEIELLPGYTKEVSEVDYEHGKGYFDHRTLSEDKLRTVMTHYYGNITHMDYHIGRIIDNLKEKGLYDDTMIIYTSDHGEYMGFHHMLLKANYMYDPLAKVPLIIKYPKGIHAGQINNKISNNTDIAPTILNCFGLSIPNEMKGIDIRNQEIGREMTVCLGMRWDHEIYYEYMVRSDKYKLIITRNLDTYRFFDLEKDPLEFIDVSGDIKYEKEIKKHIDRVINFMLFESLTPTYLNYDEVVCSDEKIMDLEKRKDRENYFKNKLTGNI